MPRRSTAFALSLALAAALLPAQQDATASSPDAALEQAHAAWRGKYEAWLERNKQAREAGQLAKGGVPPAAVQAAEAAAKAAAAEVLQSFGDRDDLAASSYLLLARMQESNRDYGAAVTFYGKALARGDAEAPDLRTLRQVCIAALNSKDDAVAAQWMAKTIAAEDAAGGRGDASVRAQYYPRVLIALGDWQQLDQLLQKLAADPRADCRAAARTFGIVAAMHRGDVAAAEAGVQAILAAPQQWPDQQGWATAARLALCVHRGDFAGGAAAVRDYLQVPKEQRTQRDQNSRRLLAAIAPFLNQPAPALRSDHCVGGELVGADVLPGLKGKVVVLDFWQPWCEPCRKAMPEMVRAQREHGEQLQVLGVCRVENYGYDVSEKRAVRPLAAADYPAHVADFRQDMQLNYPLLVCDTDANSKAFAIAGVPTLVIVDRAGIVRYMSCGAGEPGLFQLALQGIVGE